MKKPRSRLETKLSDLQQAQLAEWLLGGMRYHDASLAVEKEFGLKVGASAFQFFWEHVCVPQLLARRHSAVKTSVEIAQEAEKRPGRFDQATVDALKQRAFELSISPNPKPGDVKALFMLVLKARDQEIDKERLALDREKLELELRKYRDAVAKVQGELSKAKGGGLTPEGLKKIEEAIGLL